MKRSIIALALVLSSITGAHASSESEIADYKAVMGESIYKIGVLTHSLSETGQSKGNEIKAEMANRFAGQFDNAIASGLNNGLDCSVISNKFKTELFPQFANQLNSGGNAIVKTQVNKFIQASSDYVTAQCAYLTEK